ncbi:MAG: ligand-binding protein SH3, partial [SAR324 cluster bacterium]|nr:ligand-binding protein SH3 [SAR324 cluster bacterium]
MGGSKEGEEEALEQGFDDDEEDTAGAEGPAEAESQAEGEGIRWSLDGFVRLDASYNFAHDAPEEGQTDYRGLSKLRTALQLELSVEPGRDWLLFVSGQINRDFAYQLHDREYTPEVLDGYEQETEFREVYLRGSFQENFD